MKKYLILRAFSLVEMLITLVVVSVLLSAFVPVITKKMTKNIEVKSSVVSGSVPVGTVVMWLEDTAPEGWLLCNGATIPSGSQYDELRTFLDDTKTPDMRGLIVKGATATENTNGRVRD